MKRLFFSLSVTLVISLLALRVSAQNMDRGRILMTVANDTVTADEFLYAFRKNNDDEQETSKQEIDEYLDLYVNFKLKVVEAKSEGYDTTEEFKKEYQQYSTQLQNSYLVSDTETGRLVQEAYDRLTKEVEASHILLTLDPDAIPADTLQVYNRLMDIRNQALSGADFGMLAQQYSQDPSAKTNKGLLGYFSALQMVYPFENAAFETPVGEISMPVRTQFGYHLIKVSDVRPSEGKVRVAHIMIQPPSPQSENEINLVYEQLRAGADWQELCQQHSDDRRTANSGGELAPFGRGQIVAEFSDVAFSLDSAGQISDPFKTQFGWHIVKLLEKIPVKSLEEMEEELTRRVKRDSRNDVNKQVLLERLAKENKLQRNPEGEQELRSLPRAMFKNGRWQLDSTWFQSDVELFSINNEKYAMGSFLKQMTTKAPQDSTASFLNKQLNEYMDQELIQYEKDHLGNKNEEYRFLSKEYYEGILLFSIMEDEIWNKAMEDSIGLISYYEAHSSDYPRKKGVEAILVSSTDKMVLTSLSDSLKQAKLDHLLSETEKQDLIDKFKPNDRVSLSVEQGYYSPGENQLVDKAVSGPGQQLAQQGDFWTLAFVVARYEAGTEPLDQIRGRVMADYQDYLEKQWVEQLKGKYAVDINNKTLSYVYKRARKK